MASKRNFTQKGDRKIEIFADEELFSLAKKVAGAFERVPLPGIVRLLRGKQAADPGSTLTIELWSFHSLQK
jgi:hypothetical protein